MNTDAIEELKNNILLNADIKKSNNNWHSLNCPICGDTKMRGGFYFADDHIGYSCFRGGCSVKSTKWIFTEAFPYKLNQVLQRIGVDVPVSILTNKQSNKPQITLDSNLFEKPDYPTIKIPEQFEKFDPKKHIRFKEYLESRYISINDEYYIGAKIDKDYSWKNMIIIPFYLNNQLIGYHGRDITKKRFKTSSNNLIYLPDGKIPSNPVVVESVFDAKLIPNGVAIIHSEVSKQQAYILRNSKPILLPDRTGSRFLTTMKSYNWRMSIPEWEEKDIGEFIEKYGILVACRKIYEGVVDNYFLASVKFGMWNK